MSSVVSYNCMRHFFVIITGLLLLGTSCVKTLPVAPVNPTNPVTTTPPKSSLSVQPSQPPTIPREVLVNYINQPEGYAFMYTSQVAVQPMAEGVRLVHAVPFVHEDPCDQKDGRTLSLLTDFELTLQTVPTKQLGDWVKKNFGPEFLKESFKDNRFVPDNDTIKNVAFGGNKGVVISLGVEWCGENTYVFPLTNTTTLIATQPFGTPIDGGFDPEIKAAAEKLDGVILPAVAESLRGRILDSLTTNLKSSAALKVIRKGDETVVQNITAPFSFYYPADWALRISSRFFDTAGLFTIATSTNELFLPPAPPRVSNSVIIFESNQADLVYEDTNSYTQESESVTGRNGLTWNEAKFRRLPDGPQDERKVVAILTSPKNQNWGYKVTVNFVEARRAQFMYAYDFVKNTFAEQL